VLFTSVARLKEALRYAKVMTRVGQNHIYTVYIWYIWLGNHPIYGVYICIYTVLANPSDDLSQTAKPGLPLSCVILCVELDVGASAARSPPLHKCCENIALL